MPAEGLDSAALVARLGPHPVTQLGLRIGAGVDTERWLLVACLLSARAPEERALAAWRALEAAGLAAPETLAAAPAARGEAELRRLGMPDPERLAARLRRLAAALVALGDEGLARLAREADGLEALGGALARLASGFGPAGVLRFLRPLRDTWPAAGETPLEPAARAAAVHLGWLPQGSDVEGEPAALRAHLRGESRPAPLADAEAALARLGTAACRRNRPQRCPLADDCPAR